MKDLNALLATMREPTPDQEAQQEKRIKIAEACGWELPKVPSRHGLMHLPNSSGLNFPPDYFNDLNAMHEAEALLTYDQQELYVALCTKIDPEDPAANYQHGWDVVFNFGLHQTAAQRAEAFGKTLGLW